MNLSLIKTGFGTGMLFAINLWLVVLVCLIALPTPVRDHVRSACWRLAHPDTITLSTGDHFGDEGQKAIDRAPDLVPPDPFADAEPDELASGETAAVSSSPTAAPVKIANPAGRGVAAPTPRRKHLGTEQRTRSPAPIDTPVPRQRKRGTSSSPSPARTPPAPQKQGATVAIMFMHM